MRRRLPPAGLPLRAADVSGALSGWLSPDAARRALERAVTLLFPGKVAWSMRSGRAALCEALRLFLEETPERNELVAGGYTCWSVAAAAVRAGYRIRPVDLDPETLDFDREEMERVCWSRAGALVTHHLFGIPNDRGFLLRHTAEGGARLLDDAAQAFGAEEGGAPVGGAGEAGILSFGRGKSLPALGGGVLLVDAESPLAKRRPPRRAGGRGSGRVFRAAAHRLFFPPGPYAWIAGLPLLRIGETIYEEGFPLGEIDGYTAALSLRLLRDRAARLERRREAAARYRSLLDGSPRVRIPSPGPGTAPAYIRFPIRVPGGKRDEILRRGMPLGITGYYPSPIPGIPGLPRSALAGGVSLPGSEEIAATLLTLPTHPLVSEEDERAAAALVREVCG
ncbi:MAG: DegT/DnrJ/EryC1/StrS family aminotransferase [Candidatus Eisenbacteria bacterium]